MNDMEAASLCFFRCVRILHVLRNASARLDFHADDDSDSDLDTGSDSDLDTGSYRRVIPYDAYVRPIEVKYVGPNIYRVRYSNSQTDRLARLEDMGIDSVMHIANRWMLDKDMTKVTVKVADHEFCKSFLYPTFSADICELMLVSDVSVNPLHMRRNYRVGQLAVQIANFMKRISTILDAQEFLLSEVRLGMRSTLYIGQGLYVDGRAFINASTGRVRVRYVMGLGRTFTRRRVAEILRQQFKPSNHLVFHSEHSWPSQKLYLDYAPPSYHCNQPYLAEILEPV